MKINFFVLPREQQYHSLANEHHAGSSHGSNCCTHQKEEPFQTSFTQMDQRSHAAPFLRITVLRCRHGPTSQPRPSTLKGRTVESHQAHLKKDVVTGVGKISAQTLLSSEPIIQNNSMPPTGRAGRTVTTAPALS